MQVYWNERRKPEAQRHAAATTQQESGTSTLVSEYDQHRHALVEKSVTGWSAELCLYLSDIAGDVTKEMDVVAWWVKHSSIYPTLALMAQDVCAIPASSVPCEHLFSAGGEIATDRCSRLGSDHFEQLQILKHGWWNTIVDRATINSSHSEDHYLKDFQELYKIDEELAVDDGIEVV
ncbi:hypothetical protein SCLCIDRAFT_107925 [Scleroderma citrinum Foug A]|uniref:HAT C-terminal dimerisation domain-containing protein n=1 Tax=Scleroderma citrinum Foug A TaxID=1036808 RepID=A0A0C3E3R5_9AGAM|nr:hypothetical protein SCLCIDRAFT_107925 [Scleroderma citrinum Foug A]